MSITFWVCVSFLIIFSFLMGILIVSLCKSSAYADAKMKKLMEERLRMVMQERK